MNLYFRLAWLILKLQFLRRIQSPLEEACLSFRVLPTDLDINSHMNNGRYLTLMDLARIDFMAKTGLLPIAFRNRWFPILGSTQMIFRRPLKAFQRYEIKTTLVFWDEKWWVLSQSFEFQGKRVAYGLIRGLLKGPNGIVPTELAMKNAGHSKLVPPDPPPNVSLWLKNLDTAFEVFKKGDY